MQNKPKALALASEVLALLDRKEVTPMQGTYCRLPVDSGTVPKSESGTCEVCALGALAVACCGIPDTAWGSNTAPLIECLSGTFDAKELATIEAAFELDNEQPMKVAAYGAEYDDDIEILDDAVRFGRDASEWDPDGWGEDGEDTPEFAEQRLRAIMANIIANGGEFRP